MTSLVVAHFHSGMPSRGCKVLFTVLSSTKELFSGSNTLILWTFSMLGAIADLGTFASNRLDPVRPLGFRPQSNRNSPKNMPQSRDRKKRWPGHHGRASIKAVTAGKLKNSLGTSVRADSNVVGCLPYTATTTTNKSTRSDLGMMSPQHPTSKDRVGLPAYDYGIL